MESVTNNNLSCKQLEGYLIICIFTSDANIKVSIFNCDRECNEEIKETLFSSPSYDGFLYDTLQKKRKIFCIKTDVGQINCGSINFEDNSKILLEQSFSLSTEYNTQNCDTRDCNFTEFFSEYLLCCLCDNYIICTRFTHNFYKISDFVLNIFGKNSLLTIISNSNYLSILFLNDNNIYKKNIYPSNCKNISKEIDKEVEINIKELLDFKKDSNYYLIFEDFNSGILTINLNQKDCTSKIFYELNSDDDNLNVILKKNNIINNYIEYTISSEMAYNSTCSINLIINQTQKISNEDNTIKTSIIYESKTNLNENKIEPTSLDTIKNILKTDLYTEYNNFIMNSNKRNYSVELEETSKTSHNLCFESCETCEGTPEYNENNKIINQKCLECKNGYYFEFQTKNCYNHSIIEQGYYFSFNDSMYHKCDIIEMSKSDFKNQILKNISSFVNSTNIINGSNFIALVYSVDDIDPREQLKNGVSAIDLGNCTNIIKNYYNISKNESFIVVSIESKKNKEEKKENDDDNDNYFNLGKNLNLELYDFSGNKLNISVCQENITLLVR